MGRKTTRERWDGGYIHREDDGRPHYVIEKERANRRYHIFTGAHSETAAHDHLRRFEADPPKYADEMKHGRDQDQGIFLITALYLEFRDYLLGRDRPTTRKHANEMAHRLRDWSEDLRGLDLRRLDLAVLKDKLAKRESSRQHRIIALKSFCAWLRTEKHILDRRDDVTMDLAVPQAVPEKHRRRKAVPAKDVRRVLSVLAPAYRDCLLLLGSTGWHVTELARFARDAEARIAPGQGVVLAVLQVRHKSGATTRTAVVTKEAVAAAERIRQRGALPRRMNKTLRSACLAAKVPVFTFGVMRHSVATWAVENESPIERVADFLDHKSKSTTERFYVDVAFPKPPVKLPRLVYRRRRSSAVSSDLLN